MEVKFSTALEDFINDFDANTSSRKTYRNVINLFARYLSIAKKDLYTVNRSDIINWKAKLLETGHTAKTVNLYLSVMRKFFSWFNACGYGLDPCRGIRLVKVPHNFKRLPLNIDQVSKLLMAPDKSSEKGKRDYALIYLLLSTGLRRIEVNRLNVGDIAIINGHYFLKLQRKGHSEKDQHKIITSDLFQILNDYIVTRENYKDIDPMFMTVGRKLNVRLTTLRISEIIKEYLNVIGLQGRMYTAHSLRHTVAVTLLSKGLSFEYVQQYMGHSSIATTQLYTKGLE